MLIDVHAHFYHDRTPRADWRERNQSRLRAGEKIGITCHVASVLGTWGRTSPTYFPSADDVRLGNDALLALQREHPARIRGYCTVNPNYTEPALQEIARCRAAGMIGVKLAASRRASDPLIDPIAALAGAGHLPVLQHVWQHRRHEVHTQEASDARDLAQLAARHRGTVFILAHVGGGGDWRLSLPEIRRRENVYLDLSGSGVDGGMLEACVDAVGTGRLLWGCDITMDTGWAKLRYLEHGLELPGDALDAIRWKNAVAIFPPDAFPDAH